MKAHVQSLCASKCLFERRDAAAHHLA